MCGKSNFTFIVLEPLALRETDLSESVVTIVSSEDQGTSAGRIERNGDRALEATPLTLVRSSFTEPDSPPITLAVGSVTKPMETGEAGSVAGVVGVVGEVPPGEVPPVELPLSPSRASITSAAWGVPRPVTVL